MSLLKSSTGAQTYQFRVGGLIPEDWAEWFEGFALVPQETGETLLVGTVVDQSALHGMLIKIRDLNLELISVQKITT